MHPELEDHYHHRHLSHLYPVFPGDEVGLQDSRLPAFARAVDLRELGGQSGWSLTHMANIYARLGRGDAALPVPGQPDARLSDDFTDDGAQRLAADGHVA